MTKFWRVRPLGVADRGSQRHAWTDEKLVKIALGRQNPSMDEPNPYAPPQAELLATDRDASRVRYEYLRTEAHLKALGWFWMVLAAASLALAWLLKQLQMKDFGVRVGIEAIPWHDFVLAAISTIGGAGLVRMQGWAGNLMITVSALLIASKMLELPGSLIGIVIHAVMLRFLFDHRTRFVLSSPYKDIIRSTPLVKSEVASWVKPIVVLFLLGIAVMTWVVRH